MRLVGRLQRASQCVWLWLCDMRGKKVTSVPEKKGRGKERELQGLLLVLSSSITLPERKRERAGVSLTCLPFTVFFCLLAYTPRHVTAVS